MKKLIALTTALLMTTGIFAPSSGQLSAAPEDYYYDESAADDGMSFGTSKGLIAAGVAIIAAAIVLCIHDGSHNGH